jgi:uncharacterized protein (DUF1015 family)
MDVIPFKALRFDSSVVGDVGDCICPPYDVIDDDLQQKLYNKSEYNVVRIVKGKTSGSDTDRDNQYTRAADYLNSWIGSGALKPDPKEIIYGYVQDFEIGTGHLRRSALVTLAKLEELGTNVQPHEKTLDGPKADRLKLMRAKAAQFGQIFLLYDDLEKIADIAITNSAEKPALIDFTDDNGVRHRLYAIDQPYDIGAIINMMASKQVIIADGHHRYETALNYYKETKNPRARYRMMTFVNIRNQGLVILPTHRLIANVPDFDIDKLLKAVGGDFEITKFDFTNNGQKAAARHKMFDKMNEGFKKNKNTFGIYAANDAFYVAVLKNLQAVDQACPGLSKASKALDVNVLHRLILEKILGIGEQQLASQSNIEYIKDIGDAIDRSIAKVDSQQSQAVFFMNATKIEQVKAVAAGGEKMPQKSTFFYPKIYTGLVINKL